MKWISWLMLMPSIVYALPLRPNTQFRQAIPGEYIVRSSDVLSKDQGQLIGPDLYLVKGDLSKFKTLMEISPNYAYYGNYMESEGPNDPQFINQFHHKMLQSQDAWGISMGDEEVIVAVTDNEFELGHEDLKAAWQVNENEIPGNGVDDDKNGYIDDVLGWDFINKDNNVNVSEEENVGTHGTHVAGIIAARANNGLGVAGIAPKVKILPLKFYDGNPWTSAVVAETYYYAVKMGAKIISTSYNIDAMSTDKVYVDAVKYATEKGLIVFNSAGNNNQKNPPRQNVEELVLVCSVQSKNETVADLRSKFSNYGTGIDICAPGDPILATVRGFYMGASRYGSLSGTSMATPVAAAVAALIWSHNPNFTNTEVKEKLLSSVDDIYPKNMAYKGMLGTGRVNSLKALQ